MSKETHHLSPTSFSFYVFYLESILESSLFSPTTFSLSSKPIVPAFCTASGFLPSLPFHWQYLSPGHHFTRICAITSKLFFLPLVMHVSFLLNVTLISISLLLEIFTVHKLKYKTYQHDWRAHDLPQLLVHLTPYSFLHIILQPYWTSCRSLRKPGFLWIPHLCMWGSSFE